MGKVELLDALKAGGTDVLSWVCVKNNRVGKSVHGEHYGEEITPAHWRYMWTPAKDIGHWQNADIDPDAGFWPKDWFKWAVFSAPRAGLRYHIDRLNHYPESIDTESRAGLAFTVGETAVVATELPQPLSLDSPDDEGNIEVAMRQGGDDPLRVAFGGLVYSHQRSFRSLGTYGGPETELVAQNLSMDLLSGPRYSGAVLL